MLTRLHMRETEVVSKKDIPQLSPETELCKEEVWISLNNKISIGSIGSIGIKL